MKILWPTSCLITFIAGFLMCIAVMAHQFALYQHFPLDNKILPLSGILKSYNTNPNAEEQLRESVCAQIVEVSIEIDSAKFEVAHRIDVQRSRDTLFHNAESLCGARLDKARAS